eukprot:4850055-Prymnesium_polylepis.1
MSSTSPRSASAWARQTAPTSSTSKLMSVSISSGTTSESSGGRRSGGGVGVGGEGTGGGGFGGDGTGSGGFGGDGTGSGRGFGGDGTGGSEVLGGGGVGGEPSCRCWLAAAVPATSGALGESCGVGSAEDEEEGCGWSTAACEGSCGPNAAGDDGCGSAAGEAICGTSRALGSACVARGLAV